MLKNRASTKGVNLVMKAHILEESIMREMGFTEQNGENWHYGYTVYASPENSFSDIRISFNVIISKKDNSKPHIYVQDEGSQQPYDYKALLMVNPFHPVAMKVKMNVEKQMAYLTKQGVLSGHMESL